MNPRPDSHTLTDFTKHSPDFVRQLRETGEPIALTIDGKGALVVQDAESYQKLCDQVEGARVIAGIRSGLEEMRSGQGRPAEEVFEEIRREFSLSPDS
jgi:PHD/YefM family antitoxin component YafN of YafNO toxin-antitoxin module